MLFQSYSRRRGKDVALGVESSPDFGVGRNGPTDSTLDPTPTAWLGHAPHPKDQSRDLKCRKGEVGAGGALEA